MSAEGKSPTEQDRHCEGMRHQVSLPTDGSSQSSSSSDCSSSCDKSRPPSAEGSRGRRYSSHSRSRSRPRCFRALGRCCCHPNSSRSSRYGRQRRSSSSSPERYYPRSRRPRSSSYRRTRVAYRGKFMCRFLSSPVRRSYRSQSPGCCVRFSEKGKMELMAKENAATAFGVDVVELPSSVKCVEDQVKKTLDTDTVRRVRADPVPRKEMAQT